MATFGPGASGVDRGNLMILYLNSRRNSAADATRPAPGGAGLVVRSNRVEC